MTKAFWGLLAVLLATSPAISYFKYQRQIGAASAGGQHYAVVDETLWQHALPDLDDLRLYSSAKEIPHVLRTMRGTTETEQTAIRVLQPGTLGGKTQFLLDMTAVPEYDRITLALSTKNYVAHARVEGQDDSHRKQWVNLATITLFDLSGERLGHNSSLQIPVSTYRYLRVTIDGAVQPADVQGATAGIERSQLAVWRDLSGEAKQTQEGKDTILTFTVPENVPVERVTLTLDPAQGNFQREIEMQSDRGSTIGTGEIARVHLQRNGGRIDLERTNFLLNATSRGRLRAVIHNGDDAPLKITGASLQQYQRRIYFDCDAAASLQLYYGDSKLDAPVYDYAKLFQSDASAAQIPLGAEEANSLFTGRPDDRPWSERHPSVMWIAILAAVAVLGAIALRSIKAAAS
jgi:Protein of unknown function (DUF3999)